MCIRHCYLHISERSYSRGSGTGSVLGRPHRLLLAYTRCLGSTAREGGVASWAWGAAGSQSSKGPVNPQGEMGRWWMDRCTWPGRGVWPGNITGIISRRKRKGQKAAGGQSQHHAGDGGLLEATQSWKDWASGVQLHSLVPL